MPGEPLSPTVRERLSPTVRALLAAFFVSQIGRGLTMPFLLIYLHQVRHIALGVAGALMGGMAVVAVPVGPLSGWLVDRFGPRVVALGALVVQSAGTASLVLVRSAVSAIGPLMLFGLALGATFPTWSALLAVLVREEGHRPRVFALNFQLLNLGLGIGSVIGGLVVSVSRPSTFVDVFLADAGCTMIVVGALALLPASSFQPAAEVTAGDRSRARTGGDGSSGQPPSAGYREVFGDRRFRWYLVNSLLLATAGYGALSAGFVGYATTVVHVSARVIAWAFAANTFLIVALQPLGLRATGRMRRTTALSLTATGWALSWGVLGVAGRFPRSFTGDAFTIVMFSVFAVGEIFLSPVSGPLANDLAPPQLLGRYNAAASTTYSVANVACPPVAGAMLGAGLGNELLGLLVACCAASVWAARRLRRVLSPAEDRASALRRPAVPSVTAPGGAAPSRPVPSSDP